MTTIEEWKDRAERAEAEAASKSEQIGKLYRVCNEKADLAVRLERAEAECKALREILKACNFTLIVHGKIDHDTPLHYRIDAALNPSPAGP